MPVLPYLDHHPQLGDDVVLADDAVVVGAVTIAGPAHFASSAVARGDQSAITVGPRFHIGRGSTVHVELVLTTQIGADVWLGDRVVAHACTLEDQVRIEDGALVLSGSTVGAGSVVAAGALVPENSAFPPKSYIAGTPGRRQRDTTADERQETVERLRAALALSPKPR